MPASSRPRGPEFLPYPRPTGHPPAAGDEASASAPAEPVEPVDRAGRAGRAAKVLAAVAVLAVAVLSLALGWRAWGAVTATAAAAGGLGLALRRRVVRTSELVGSAAAAAALLLLFTGPSTLPTETAAPHVDLSPPSPADPPFELPPAATAVPGVPTEPGPPLDPATTATGLLVGRVLDRGGQPVAGAPVVVTRAKAGDVSDTPGCPVRLQTTSDATGSYRLSLCQLADGLGYTVRIGVTGATAQATVYVNAGRTTVYNVILDLRHA